MESGPASPLPTQPGSLEAFPKRRLEAGDMAVLVLYFLFVLAVGLWVSQPRGRRGGGQTGSRSHGTQNATASKTFLRRFYLSPRVTGTGAVVRVPHFTDTKNEAPGAYVPSSVSQ